MVGLIHPFAGALGFRPLCPFATLFPPLAPSDGKNGAKTAAPCSPHALDTAKSTSLA